VNCALGRDGWNEQLGIGVFGASNVQVNDNQLTATHDAVPALVDSGALGGYFGMFMGRYHPGRSQPLESLSCDGNAFIVDGKGARSIRVCAAAIRVERVGQRAKWQTATGGFPIDLLVSGSTVTLNDPRAFFHQGDVGASLHFVNMAQAGNNGVFTVTEVTGTNTLKFENTGTPNEGSKTVGTYRLKPKAINSSQRGSTCSVSRNSINGYGATGIDIVSCVAPEIVGNTFNAMGTAVIDLGSVGPRIVGSREVRAGSDSARIQLSSTTSWPYIDDNIITNGSLAGGNTSIDGVLLPTRTDMGIGVDSGTAIDYPLCGKRGRTKSTNARAELVLGFGREYVDGDTVDINNTVCTYDAASPNNGTGGTFSTLAGLVALVGSGFTAEDYGTGLTDTPTTGHVRVRLTSPAHTADHGYAFRVTTLNPTAMVALFNKFDPGPNEAVAYTRGEGVAMTGSAWGMISAATFTANHTTGRLTITAHGLVTGDGLGRLTNSGGALPTGLAAGTDYWIIRVDADSFQVATSRANALVGTAVAFSDNGTGTHTITMSLARRITVWSTACQRTAGVIMTPDNQTASLLMSGGWYRETASTDAGACEVVRTNTSMGSDEEFRWVIP
jgi:hypothetical protein